MSMPSVTRVATRAVPLLLGAALVTGCSAGTPPPSAAPPSLVPVSLAPVTTAPPASEPAPVEPSATPPAGDPGDPGEAPPVATLTSRAATAVEGELGGFTWAGGGSDAPWIVVPARDAARGGGPWTVGLDPALEASGWTVAWARIRDGVAGPVAGHAAGAAGPIAFEGPAGRGTWSLRLVVRFGDLGDAAYYWRLAPDR